MKKVILEFPLQFKADLNLTNAIKKTGSLTNIIVAGIGGSALPADILKIAFPNLRLRVWRDYDLPQYIDENTLLIVTSYSGNTEEPLSSLAEGMKKGLDVCAVSSGGKLEKTCQEKNIPFIKIPSGVQPRSATGFIFLALAKIIKEAGFISEIPEELTDLPLKLEKISPALQKRAENLTKELSDKIPVIYASRNFKFLARIWKIKFNENSKIPSFWNFFPELNHNEMVGFSKPKNNNFHLIIFRDENDNPRNLKRMELTSKTLKEKGIITTFINLEKGDIFYKVFANLLFGDWTSYYLALEQGIDPTPVAMIEEFKKELE